MLNFLFRRTRQAKRLRRIDQTVARIGGGITKRIDENRELLEVLQARCPHLLRERPWIVGWLRANDEFFAELDRLRPEPAATGDGARDIDVVRPWPTATRT